MRACVQRVRFAEVVVDGETIGKIEQGMLVLLGVEQGDDDRDVRYMADKLVGLRIFNDDQNKMNRSLIDVAGQMLLVSQFTLSGDCRKGRRPSFITAAEPTHGQTLYEAAAQAVRAHGVTVETGRFQAHMEVTLLNDGPVTLLIDSKKKF